MLNASIPNPDGNGFYKMAYSSFGNPDAGRTVVCVHGLTRNRHDFDILADALASQGYHVICPDMPGRGDSSEFSNPEWYSNPIYAQGMVQFIASLQLQQVDWIGTSMGGLIALILAATAPRSMRRLVLNDIGAVVSSAALKRIGEYISKPNSFETFRDAEDALFERTASFGIPEARWGEFSKNSIEHMPDGKSRLRYDAAIAKSMVSADLSKDIELWPFWEPVKPIPTLLIRGEKSDILTEETAEKMRTTHPHLTRFNVPGVGHAPALMTQPEIEAIVNFLKAA